MKHDWNYPWVFAPNLSEDSDRLNLFDEELRHIASVLRCRNGDCLFAFDGQGGVRSGILTLNPKQGFIVFKGDFQKIQQESKPYNLIPFLPNNVATFEIVLRKCCELGIRAVYPILGERSERKQWQSSLWDKRKERFQRILIESCKQAKNPFLPIVFPPASLQSLNLQVVGNCYHGTLLAKSCYLRAENDKNACSIIVGPEGGFSEAEEAYLTTFSSGIGLPTYVLRVETAVVSLVTAVKLGEKFF